MNKNPCEDIDHFIQTKLFQVYDAKQVCITLCQKKNCICIPTVYPGEYVRKGQIIGRPMEKDEACVHASISGYVKKIMELPYDGGKIESLICIEKNTEDERTSMGVVENFGVAKGMFQPAHRIIINGVSEHPTITSVDQLLFEESKKIFLGAVWLSLVTHANEIHIVSGSPNVVRFLKKHILESEFYKDIEIIEETQWKYDEKYQRENTHIYTVAEIIAVYNGIYENLPWTETGISITGNVSKPKNIRAPIGTCIEELIQFCGGWSKGDIVICGSPLYGQRIDPAKTWTTREMQGIIVLPQRKKYISNCIHCGMCHEICPKHLYPDQIEKKAYNMAVSECLQCGMCSYVCPSERRLKELIGQAQKGRSIKNEKTDLKDTHYISISKKMIRDHQLQRLDLDSHSAPYIHQKGTVREVMLYNLASMLPLFIGYFWYIPEQRWHFLAALIVAGGTAVFTEFFWQKLNGQYISIEDFSACFTGICMVFLCSAEISLLRLCVGVILALIIGKHLLGGLGASIIHPAILGKWLIDPFSIPSMEPLYLNSLLGCLFLMITNILPWRYPLLFFLGMLLFMKDFLCSASFYFVCSYFLWNYETMQSTKNERDQFVFLVMILFYVCYQFGLEENSVIDAIGLAQIGFFLKHRLCGKSL